MFEVRRSRLEEADESFMWGAALRTHEVYTPAAIMMIRR
jgi:hypothetical protein